jgi:hypothetical protein
LLAPSLPAASRWPDFEIRGTERTSIMTRLRLILLSLYVVFGITVTWQWLHYRLQDPNEKVERDPAPIAFVQNWWLRKKLRASLTTKPPSRSVVIVSCGWRARKIYGPLPWPRDFFATLIEKLRASGGQDDRDGSDLC